MCNCGLGADVVRVDRALTGVPDVLARGKRSIVANLKHAAGVRAVRRLTDGADVVIEPFRPGVMEKLGLGPKVTHIHTHTHT